MVEYLRVFRHVGFFVFVACEIAATEQGRLIMYIGGGLLTLVIVVVLVMFVLRR